MQIGNFFIEGGGSGSGGGPAAERAARERKEAAHLVRKAWRAAHVDCSAKYNWNVVAVFKELAVMLDMIANGQVNMSQWIRHASTTLLTVHP